MDYSSAGLYISLCQKHRFPRQQVLSPVQPRSGTDITIVSLGLDLYHKYKRALDAAIDKAISDTPAETISLLSRSEALYMFWYYCTQINF